MDKVSSLREFELYLSARCRPSTTKVYVHALKLWFSYLNGSDPSQRTAQSYIDSLIKMKLSSSTINLRGHAIRRWFKWRGKTIELDYPTSIHLGDPEYLTIDEIGRLIAVCRTPLERMLVIVLFDTAIRISELLNLYVDCIDWKRKLISITRKGGKSDLVNVSDRGLQALRDWLDARAFNTEKVLGNIEYYDVWALIKSIGKRANLRVKLRPHLFRHSRAIHMLMNGAALTDVQQHLGHRSIATTANVYGRFKAIDLKARIPKW